MEVAPRRRKGREKKKKKVKGGRGETPERERAANPCFVKLKFIHVNESCDFYWDI